MSLLLGAEQISERVEALAAAIASGMPADSEAELVVVIVLKGAFVFGSDLVRALHARGVRCRLEFIRLSSYGSGTESTGEVRMEGGLPPDLQGRRVLLVDDILDTGRSLARARDLFEAAGADVEVCVLLDKPERRHVELEAQYVGFEVPNRFVVGYGIDHAERYRELPFVGTLDD